MTQQLTITLPHDAAGAAATQKELEEQALDLQRSPLVIHGDDEYSLADEFLSTVRARKKSIEDMRDRVVKPLNVALKEARSWFAPSLAAADAVEESLKGSMKTYRLALAERQRAADALVREAARANDAKAVVEALQVRQESAKPSGARASFRQVWVVDKVDESALPDQYWCVDWSALKIAARNAPGDGPAPEIAGVIFRRDAVMGAR